VSFERTDSTNSLLTSHTINPTPFGDMTIPEEEEEEEEDLTPMQAFLAAINPINTEEWSTMPWYLKAYEVFKAPILFFMNLTCPVVNYDVEGTHNWNRHLQSLQMFLAPPISVLLVVGVRDAGPMPLCVYFLIVGIPLAALVWFTSENDKKPKYHSVFGYLGFLFALVWIYTLANEIVALLVALGVVFNISNAILGLTLLAWGNSIGDWIANTMMARQGFARMGFSACYGSPFFNLCMGFGVPLTIKMISDGTTKELIDMEGVQLILTIFLAASLASTIIALPLVFRFHLKKIYGFYLLILYAVFLVVAILTESGLFLDDWEP